MRKVKIDKDILLDAINVKGAFSLRIGDNVMLKIEDVDNKANMQLLEVELYNEAWRYDYKGGILYSREEENPFYRVCIEVLSWQDIIYLIKLLNKVIKDMGYKIEFIKKD